MNQPQPMPPYMGQPKPAVNKWLLIIFIIVVLAGAGFFWYYFFGPGKTTGTTATTPATTTTTDETADWNTFKSDAFSYSIKYPKDWSYKTEDTDTSFAPKTATEKSMLSISVKTDSLATVKDAQKTQMGKDNTFKEEVAATVAKEEATKLSFVNNADRTITPAVYLIEKNSKVYVITDEGTTENSSIVKKMIGTFKFISATTSTETSTDLTYTNSTYGFTMTFPAAWKGYKFKEANLEGATMTYYVEVPTTDKSATGDSTADAGYYSPFAISVYTLDQWNTVEASEGPKDTLIEKTDKYAFAWSQANGTPPSDFTMSKDIQTIIDSFKLK